MYNKQYFVDLVKKSDGKKILVVSAPHDEGTIAAICMAHEHGFVDLILVGDPGKIGSAAQAAGYDVSAHRIVEVTDPEQIADRSVQLIADGEGNVLMKGLIDTSTLLHSVLKEEYGLRTGRLFSHIALLLKEDSDRYYLLTDAGINISPDLRDKQHIIENAVDLAHALGKPMPKVAVLCAKDKPYAKMPATMDAQALFEMGQSGDLTGCIVSAPLQLDNAVSKKAAEIKCTCDSVAGEADILLAPTIEVANVLAKGLKYMGGFTYAGVVMGAKVPIVLVSRSDSETEKTLSIAIACACV